MIKKVKNTVLWKYVINDLNGEEIIGTVYEKELQKTNQEEVRIEKVIKKKGNKLHVKWKGYDNSFNSWINERLFSKPYEPFGGDIDVKVDLSNHATRNDLKDATGIDTSNFALKSNLAGLRTEVDKLDTDKLVPVPVNLSTLSDAVKYDVVKKIVYDKLVAKVNNIDTTGFVLKSKYDTDKSDLEKKISDTNNLVKKNRFKC